MFAAYVCIGVRVIVLFFFYWGAGVLLGAFLVVVVVVFVMFLGIESFSSSVNRLSCYKKYLTDKCSNQF